MQDKLILIFFFAAAVGAVWCITMLLTPHRGFMKWLEQAACGAGLCWAVAALLSPIGVVVPQTPFSALLTGWLGLPGLAFSVFLSMLP